MDIGSVSVTKAVSFQSIFPKNKEIEKIKHEVDKHIDNIEWLKDPGVDAAYAVGGSARAMCNIDRALGGSTQEIHGYRMFADDILPLYTKLLDMEAGRREAGEPALPRANLYAGARNDNNQADTN